ncbi:uncharacterized abhydrolase domain-containing protein DDB_G0269086 [Drosophila grimshawi]|uniref:GH17646 n=1 Tax=Drosophila grimshawi TaxID=7222 RepID=B4JX34_DROGR|nr:uncharacterized abhydrolase domain-containing protein DDB_G0269086 [Drosophila grimshawi]EDV95310.1 GH17646 [Drosophila grimshawi]
MAFVASIDERGNEIMRIMLYPDTRSTTQAVWRRWQDVRVLQAQHMEHQDERVRKRQLLLMHPNCQDPEKPQAARCQSEKQQTEKQQSEKEQPEKEQPEKEQPEKEQPEKEQPEKEQPEKEHPEKEQPVKQQPEHLDMEKSQQISSEMNAHHKPQDQMNEGRNSPFYSWLAAKNEAQQQEAFDRRLIAQLDDQLALERAKLAEVKYQHWYQTKARLRRSKSEMSSTPAALNSHSARQSITAAEAHRRLLAWEQEKLSELRAKRLEREERQARQQLIETTRRELNLGAYEQWKDAARNRPKPVAMGRGLDSLRATNAPHYINPKQWQSPMSTAQRTALKPDLEKIQRSMPDYERLHRLAQPRQRLQVANKHGQSCPTSTVESNRSCSDGTAKAPKKQQLQILHKNKLEIAQNTKPEMMQRISQMKQQLHSSQMRNRSSSGAKQEQLLSGEKKSIGQAVKAVQQSVIDQTLPMKVGRKHETLKDCVQQDALPEDANTELNKNEADVDVEGQVAKSGLELQAQLGRRIYGGASQLQLSRMKNQKSKPWR